MVVEVPGRRVKAKADVHAQIGAGQDVAIPRPDHLVGLAQEPKRGDGEHLVGVKGTVVGGDQHGPDSSVAARGDRPCGHRRRNFGAPRLLCADAESLARRGQGAGNPMCIGANPAVVRR